MSAEVTEARRVLIKLGRTPEYLDALTVFVRAVVAESRPQPSAPERPAEKSLSSHAPGCASFDGLSDCSCGFRRPAPTDHPFPSVQAINERLAAQAKGSGSAPRESDLKKKWCWKCSGKGAVRCVLPLRDETCPVCHGTGDDGERPSLLSLPSLLT